MTFEAGGEDELVEMGRGHAYHGLHHMTPHLVCEHLREDTPLCPTPQHSGELDNLFDELLPSLGQSLTHHSQQTLDHRTAILMSQQFPQLLQPADFLGDTL